MICVLLILHVRKIMTCFLQNRQLLSLDEHELKKIYLKADDSLIKLLSLKF